MIIWINCECDECKAAIAILDKNIYCKTYTDDEFRNLLKDGHLSYFSENSDNQMENPNRGNGNQT